MANFFGPVVAHPITPPPRWYQASCTPDPRWTFGHVESFCTPFYAEPCPSTMSMCLRYSGKSSVSRAHNWSTRPVVVTIFTHVNCRLPVSPSVPTIPNLLKQYIYQVKTVIATGGTVGRDKGITDDRYLARVQFINFSQLLCFLRKLLILCLDDPSQSQPLLITNMI